MDYIFPSLLVVMSVWLVVDILIKVAERVSELNQRNLAIRTAKEALHAFIETEKAKRKPRKIK